MQSISKMTTMRRNIQKSGQRILETYCNGLINPLGFSSILKGLGRRSCGQVDMVNLKVLEDFIREKVEKERWTLSKMSVHLQQAYPGERGFSV